MFSIFTNIGFALYFIYGRFDFEGFEKHLGPHGIGVKRFWTAKHQNHVLVFYPIQKYAWKKVMHKQYKNATLDYEIFGDEERKGMSKMLTFFTGHDFSNK